MSLCFWKCCPGKRVDQLGDWDYVEAAGSGRTSVTTSGMETERRFYIKWSSFPQFIDDVLGYSKLDYLVNILQPDIIRVTPDSHPYINNCFAIAAEVEGDGINGVVGFDLPERESTSGSAGPMADCFGCDFINYKKCMVKVKYGRPNYTVAPYYDNPEPGDRSGMPPNPYAGTPPDPPRGINELSRYISLHPTFSGEYMRLDTKNPYKWCSDNRFFPSMTAPYRIPLNRINALTTLDYIWKEVPGGQIYYNSMGDVTALSSVFTPPNWNTIMEALGKLNSVPFDPYNFAHLQYYDPTLNVVGGFPRPDLTSPGLPAGCVLFVGVEPKLDAPRLTQSFRDSYTWTMTFKFAVRMNQPLSPYLGPGGVGVRWAGHQYVYNANKSYWDLITSGTTEGVTIPPVFPDGTNVAGYLPKSIFPVAPTGLVGPPPPPNAFAFPQYQMYDLNRLFKMLG